MAKKQGTLPTMKVEKVEAIETAAEVVEECIERLDRARAGKVSATEQLIDAMTAAKVTTYKSPDGELTVNLKNKKTVQVKRKKEEQE